MYFMAANLKGAKVTWLGHGTFRVTSPQGKVILFDAWTTGNPACPPELKQLEKVDLLLMTHGHGDHVGDLAEIVTKHQPTTIAMAELAGWIASKGGEHVIDMNIGGSTTVDGITVTLTRAVHSSSLPDKSGSAGEPTGFVVRLENGFTFYFSGDTDVFGDMALIRELYEPELAFLSIGDHYTMGPKGAALAVGLLGVKQVIPMHYGTFPILVGSPAGLREELNKRGLTDVEVLGMQPGQTLE
jgi:L-ascorbate metabolism protein UlaG (beta-lactamase superfamily)